MVLEPPRGAPSARPASSGWRPDEIELAVRLWKAGATAADIAGRLGRSRNAVLGKLGRLGLRRAHDSRSRSRRGAEGEGRPTRASARWRGRHDDRELRRLWADSLCPEEIAVRLRCSAAAVAERAQCLGLMAPEAAERFSSPAWFARNQARFAAAMRRAIARGSVTIPADVPEAAARLRAGSGR